MTKTNLALIVGGALAYALFGVEAGNSTRSCRSGETPAGISSGLQLAWEQPPGVPPTGRGTRPKATERSSVIPV